MIWTGIGINAHGSTRLMQLGIALEAEGQGWDLVAPWWVAEPKTPTAPNPMSLTVRPGDTVQISTQQAASPTSWTFTVRDVTTGQSSQGTCQNCSTGGHTAAWVLEDPWGSNGYEPFADPATVRFSSVQVAFDGGPLQTPAASIMQPLDREVSGHCQGPSSWNADGSFTLTATGQCNTRGS
jgi:hypothetical protein